MIGVLAGLVSALIQALGYFLSRDYLSRPGHTPTRLLALSTIWLGLFCLPLLFVVWQPPAQGYVALGAGLGVLILGFIGAQIFFFWTVRQVAASRVAPMLGLKILSVTLLAVGLGNAHPTLAQWAAVGLSVVAAVVVQRAAEPLPRQALLGVLGTVCCFALADNGVLMTQQACSATPGLERAMLTMALKYVCCLPLAVPLALLSGAFGAGRFRAALPYAVAWLGAMGFLFLSFSLIGVVLAVICQAMRGPFSVLLGMVVAARGWRHLEQPQSRSMLLRQVAAAALMVLAIAWYSLA